MTVVAAGAQEEGAAAAAAVTLISFDVDGTLIKGSKKASNRLHKECFTAAFERVFGRPLDIDSVPHHGGTDPLILIHVLEHHNVCSRAEAMARLKEMEAAMLDHYQQHAAGRAGDGLETLPGVPELLAALQARQQPQQQQQPGGGGGGGGVLTGLVTGNLEPIGWGKMHALGLEPLFTRPLLGGFGSDVCSGQADRDRWHEDRAAMVRLVRRRALALLPGGGGGGGGGGGASGGTSGSGGAADASAGSGSSAEEQQQQVVLRTFHVGDTPMDVRAALDAGAVAIGVLTGVFDRRSLVDAAGGEAALADGRLVVLDSLADTEHVLRVLGLEAEK